MGLFDRFRRKPAEPPRPAASEAFVLRLKQAPAVQPLPVTPGDPLDCAVLALWQDFQRRNSSATWPAFIGWLTTTNADLDGEITKIEKSLADYPQGAAINR